MQTEKTNSGQLIVYTGVYPQREAEREVDRVDLRIALRAMLDGFGKDKDAVQFARKVLARTFR